MREIAELEALEADLRERYERVRLAVVRLSVDERAIQARRWIRLEEQYGRALTYERYRWLDMRQQELFADADQINRDALEAMQRRARRDRMRLRPWRGRFYRPPAPSASQSAVLNARQRTIDEPARDHT